jgi:hypothetical protein
VIAWPVTAPPRSSLRTAEGSPRRLTHRATPRSKKHLRHHSKTPDVPLRGAGCLLTRERWRWDLNPRTGISRHTISSSDPRRPRQTGRVHSPWSERIPGGTRTRLNDIGLRRELRRLDMPQPARQPRPGRTRRAPPSPPRNRHVSPPARALSSTPPPLHRGSRVSADLDVAATPEAGELVL